MDICYTLGGIFTFVNRNFYPKGLFKDRLIVSPLLTLETCKALALELSLPSFFSFSNDAHLDITQEMYPDNGEFHLFNFFRLSRNRSHPIPAIQSCRRK